MNTYDKLYMKQFRSFILLWHTRFLKIKYILTLLARIGNQSLGNTKFRKIIRLNCRYDGYFSSSKLGNGAFHARTSQ